MSQTIQTEIETTNTCDENVTTSPTYRSLLSEEEYQRQKREFTKQELKKAQLFYQHTFHFCVLSVVDKLRPLWNRKALCAGSLLVVLVLGFLLFSSGPSKQTSEGGGLVPTMTFAQRVTNLPYEFLERISRLAGRSKKELLLPEDSLFSSSSSFFANQNESEAHHQHEEVKSKAAAAERKKSSAAEAANKQASPAGDASKKAALVDAQEPSFSSFLASDTYKGMDIFTFAFCVARDFAASVFSSAFGWSNGTAQAA